MKKTIRIGFVVDETHQILSWEKELINSLIEIPSVHFVAKIVGGKKRKVREPIAVNIFRAFENIWFKSIPDSFAFVDAGCEEVIKYDALDYNNLTMLDLDIIYQCYTTQINAGLERYARYGLWYYSFSDENKNNSNAPAFWEVMNDESEVVSSLNVRSANGQSICLEIGSISIVPYSVKNTKSLLGWKSAYYMKHRINELMQDSFTNFQNKKANGLVSTNFPLKPLPGNVKMTFLFLRNVFRYLMYKVRPPAKKRKFKLLVSNQRFSFNGLSLDTFTELKNSKDSFWADPFIIEHKKGDFIFFEEYDYRQSKAHISVFQYNPTLTEPAATPIIFKPYHLSYPFIFKFQETFYMIPESSSNKSVELYKCLDFPFKWEFVKNIMTDIELIDVTLIYHNSKWWLFGNQQSHKHTSTNDQLFLYYSDDLFSEYWHFHPKNPIANFASNSRPAGRIFQMGQKLYRPSQNNASKIYGYGTKINEIEELNEFNYIEKVVYEILPDSKKMSGVHTINFGESHIVIDALM